MTITQTFQKTCPEWWMIKPREKSAALLQRIMIVLPAIPHGRSDGFIMAATENRQKECISWGFKILSRETVFRLKHPHGPTRHLPFCNSVSGCPLAAPLIYQSTMAWWHAVVNSSPAIDYACALLASSPHARIDLSGHRLTLHQLGGVSRLCWRPKEQIAFSPNYR